MATVTLEEAQARLRELIDQLQPGQELLIVRDNQLVARLTGEGKGRASPRKAGTLKGTVLYMAPDFNACCSTHKLWPSTSGRGSSA
jgi:antitoxin (DNA-binding transcriptional repressor) of toxin-antitoxin stability system